MDKGTASAVLKALEAIFGQINETLHLVNNQANLETRKEFQQVLGEAVAKIDVHLIEPIYKQYPELRHPDMEEIKWQ